MSRHTKCSRDEILTILELIDSGNYTQKEIAERYSTTPSTISNYNRLQRLRFRDEKYSDIIASQNKEILALKERFNLDTTKERKVPKGFKNCTFVLKGPNGYLNEDGEAVYGFFTKSRLDAKQFVEIHPEYHFYTIVSDDNNNPVYVKTDSFVRKYGFFLSRANLGHITDKYKLKILDYEIQISEKCKVRPSRPLIKTKN